MSRILIAEDEPRVSSFLEKGLRAAGHTTTVCADGILCVALARDGDFDLLILDIGLPGLDGFGALRAIRERGERMPVLIVTARDDVELERLLSDVALKASPLLNGRLEVDPAPTNGPLRADAQRLVQALINLIKNAREHTRPGTPIALRAVSEGDAWRFEVADGGEGLDAADEQHVFQPFYKRPDSAGSGLGLAIVSGIARAHGGAAGLDNRPGDGATFWIRIPR